MWYATTHTYVVLENIAFSTKITLILLMSAFFGKNSTLTESKNTRNVIDCSDLFSVFRRYKVFINENLSFAEHVSGIQLPDCSKLVITWKLDNDICRFDVIVNFFWSCRVSLVKFSDWSEFHVNIMTAYGVTTIFVYKGFTRNPDLINIVPSSEFCPISGDWDRLGIWNLAWHMQVSEIYLSYIDNALLSNNV